MTVSRWAALGILGAAVIASLVHFSMGTPSLPPVLRVAVAIILWFPIKGALLRFLGGMRPYRSALTANGVSEVIGLGFPLLSLGVPWPALSASLVLSTFFEGLTFVALKTGNTWWRNLGLALYLNVFAHLLLAGIFLYAPQVLSADVARVPRPMLGALIILLSFLIFILPIFVVSRAPRTDFAGR